MASRSNQSGESRKRGRQSRLPGRFECIGVDVSETKTICRDELIRLLVEAALREAERRLERSNPGHNAQRSRQAGEADGE